MVRRFSDSVQVRVRSREQEWEKGCEKAPCPSAGAAPEAFIWRGRLYVVRSVLAQWRERRAWWRDALEADEAQVRPGETLVAEASEQHVWRVEASPGWSLAPGVYDLAHDESPKSDRWSLVRVSD
ncbi:MAG: DUF6504 family protein [Terrabacter sp.]